MELSIILSIFLAYFDLDDMALAFNKRGINQKYSIFPYQQHCYTQKANKM